MISVAEAEQLIISHLSPLDMFRLPISKLESHILRESCYSDRPYPPFHRVAMDGICIDSNPTRRFWDIQGLQKAGEEPKTLNSDSHCLEIMTGAMLPHNSNTVVRYEDIDLRDGSAFLKPEIVIKPRSNIHWEGSDCSKNDLLVESGRLINAPLTGILAAIGKDTLSVSYLPKIAIVGTGDELVPVHETPAPYQIRASNALALNVALGALGIRNVSTLTICDEPDSMRETFAHLLATHDMLLLTGGVSAGKFDCVPKLLSSLNVQKVFHKVRQKPGKPLWFGIGEDQQIVFGLPGNPQSALVCFVRYVLVALRRLMASKRPNYEIRARLRSASLIKPNNLTQFIPVCISQDDNAVIFADPIAHQGSGDFVALAHSDGFLELAEAHTHQEGDTYPFFPWQNFL
jgi:molybdopterin molybdotransferase